MEGLSINTFSGMSPYIINQNNGNANVWIVNSTGQLDNNNTAATNGVRPSFKIK